MVAPASRPAGASPRCRDLSLLVKKLLAVLVAGAVLQTALYAVPAGSQPRTPRAAASPGAQPAAQPSAPPETPDAVTRHTVTVDGKPIDYIARAGTITLRNEQEQPTARVFYTGYTTDAAARTHGPVRAAIVAE